MSLFADGGELPVKALDCVQVMLGDMQLRYARAFGDCWLGCEPLTRMGLDRRQFGGWLETALWEIKVSPHRRQTFGADPR